MSKRRDHMKEIYCQTTMTMRIKCRHCRLEGAENAGYRIGYYNLHDEYNYYESYANDRQLQDAFLNGWNDGQDKAAREYAVNAELDCEDGPWDADGRL